MYHSKGAILPATGASLSLTAALAYGVMAATLIIAALVLFKLAHKAKRSVAN